VVDVVKTILCVFCHIPAKNLAFFSKTNVMIAFVQKLALVSAKSLYFRHIPTYFGENNLRIITSVPGHTAKQCDSLQFRGNGNGERDSNFDGREKQKKQANIFYVGKRGKKLKVFLCKALFEALFNQPSEF
jgi:hypothetical protein